MRPNSSKNRFSVNVCVDIVNDFLIGPYLLQMKLNYTRYDIFYLFILFYYRDFARFISRCFSGRLQSNVISTWWCTNTFLYGYLQFPRCHFRREIDWTQLATLMGIPIARFIKDSFFIMRIFKVHHLRNFSSVNRERNCSIVH